MRSLIAQFLTTVLAGHDRVAFLLLGREYRAGGRLCNRLNHRARDRLYHGSGDRLSHRLCYGLNYNRFSHGLYHRFSHRLHYGFSGRARSRGLRLGCGLHLADSGLGSGRFLNDRLRSGLDHRCRLSYRSGCRLSDNRGGNNCGLGHGVRLLLSYNRGSHNSRLSHGGRLLLSDGCALCLLSGRRLVLRQGSLALALGSCSFAALYFRVELRR